MANFVVIPTAASAESAEYFDRIMPEKLGDDCYKLPRGEWLAAYRGTSRQLSDLLGITISAKGAKKATYPAVVLNFNSYWGHAAKDIWEWISSRESE